MAARTQIKAIVETDAGVQAQETRLRATFATWWEQYEPLLAGFPGSNNLMTVRGQLMTSFAQTLQPVGLLDRFQVAGVIATWWNAGLYDFKTLSAQGFGGLLDSWVATIHAEMAGEETQVRRTDPLDHKLVQRLLPEYVTALAAQHGIRWPSSRQRLSSASPYPTRTRRRMRSRRRR